MYKAMDLAKYIVTKCAEDNQSISNLQLQKILYFIQRDFLKIQDAPAFRDDIEAWQFGPVVPNVYYNFCGYGSGLIDVQTDADLSISDAVVDGIVIDKRSQKPWDLVEETHKPNGAWDQVYENGAGNKKVISIELIKSNG